LLFIFLPFVADLVSRIRNHANEPSRARAIAVSGNRKSPRPAGRGAVSLRTFTAT
jgi:hypothetical protein